MNAADTATTPRASGRWPANATLSMCSLLICVLILPACGGRDLDAVGTAGTPFILLLSPEHAPPEADRAALEGALQEAAGMTVRVVSAPNSQAATTRAGTGRFDAAILPLFDYLFCQQEHSGQARLQLLRGDGQRTYRAEFLVRAADGPKDIKALAGKRVAFVDRYSTSGFLFPAALLADNGVVPDSVFTGTHKAALAELRAGRADAAATFAGAATGDTSLRVLAQTAAIPNEPVFFRNGLNAATRQKMVLALLQLGQTETGRKLLHGLADGSGFLPVTDAAYGEVHDAIERAGSRIEDLVPQGWRIRHENARSLLGDFAL